MIGTPVRVPHPAGLPRHRARRRRQIMGTHVRSLQSSRRARRQARRPGPGRRAGGGALFLERAARRAHGHRRAARRSRFPSATSTTSATTASIAATATRRVETAAFAGMPSTRTCLTCHSQLFVDAPLLAPLHAATPSGRPIAWTLLHKLPDFVYFDHSIHVAKGVGCVECHGRVDQMPLDWRSAPLLMQWCLDCHRDPEPHLRPRDQVFVDDADVACTESRQPAPLVPLQTHAPAHRLLDLPSLTPHRLPCHPRRAIAVIALHAEGDDGHAGITRRGALQWMAASLALANAACTRAPRRTSLPVRRSRPRPGAADCPRTTRARSCATATRLGVLVGTREGRPIKIEGNPRIRRACGATDVFAQASILELWDPDRSQSVRTAPCGNGVAGRRARPACPRPGPPSTTPGAQRAATLAARPRARPRGADAALHLAHAAPRSCRRSLHRFPEARWHRHAPLLRPSRARRRAARLRPRVRLAAASRSRPVRRRPSTPIRSATVPGRAAPRARLGFAARRHGARARAHASRAVRRSRSKRTPGLFGARADERIALAPRRSRR